jgi:4-amino-4-deoxy-L-arabinose transferase-like glycosyltransferase
MKNKYIWCFLFLIIILGGILRLWQLGNIPPSPDWDEVALGYDGYSIIHTGRDEYGKFLPVVLRSFDDYKPALYAYLTIPWILLFGLNVFAVRLPSALSGIISIVAIFFLIRELFEDYRYRDYLGLATSFLFAISPWSIQFSRVGFESNVGVGLNILTALFFLKGLKKPWFLSIASLFAALNLYVYQSEKVFTPLFVISLILIYRKKLFSLGKKYLLLALVVGLIVVAPMLLYIVTDKSSLLRVKGTSIFSSQTELLKTDILKLEQDTANNDKLGLILDNRRIVYAETIISGYLSHFDLNWLFITGDISRHHAPNMGLLYIFEFPFILFGIHKLIFGNFDKKSKFLVFAWFILAPVPASITTGVPHAVRTLNFLPTYQIFASIGILSAFFALKGKRLRWVFYLIFSIVFVLNFSYYLDQYFVQLNYYDSQDWQYGYEQAVAKVETLGDNYKEIVVSDNQPLDKSYMFFLFYLKYSPQEYQKVGKNSSGGFAAHHSFGKYTFRPINWAKDGSAKNTLFIGSPKEIPSGANILQTIYNLDGTPAIEIVGT